MRGGKYSTDTDAKGYLAVNPKSLLAISAFWFGHSFLWSCVLFLWLPEQVHRFYPELKGTYVFYITSAGAFVSTVIQLIIGPISDTTCHRWGRRRPYILFGVLASIPFVLLLAIAPNYSLLLVGFLLLQLFINIASGPYQALIPDLIPSARHGIASAYMGFAIILAQGFALPISGVLIQGIVFPLLSLDARLLILSVIVLVVLIATMLWTVLGVRELQFPGLGRKNLLKHILDIRLKGEPDFAWLIVSRFFINVGFYTAVFFLDYYIRESIGLGDKAPMAVALLALIITYSALLGTIPAGKYADRFSKKGILYITCAVISVAVLWFLLLKNMVLVCIVGVVFGIGWGAFQAVDWALAANLVPIREVGRYMAIWHLAFTVPQVVAPVVGPIADRINALYGNGLGWRFALGTILIYLALGVWALRFIRERPVTLQMPTDYPSAD